MLASEMDLEDLVDHHVRSLKEFSGIPVGTVGLVVEAYENPNRTAHRGVMVLWTTTRGVQVRDVFRRDDSFDETQWLEVVD